MSSPSSTAIELGLCGVQEELLADFSPARTAAAITTSPRDLLVVFASAVLKRHNWMAAVPADLRRLFESSAE